MSDRPTWLYRLLVPFFKRIVSTVWGIECEGLEHVPPAGKLIIAVNHRSWVDPPLTSFAVYPKRFATFIGKRELFRIPIFGWFLRASGAIPLDRGGPDVTAVRAAAGVLERDGCLVLFPEGTRTRTGLPGKPKPGVGFLAQKTGATVVPARVWNTEKFWRKARLRIRFGSPMQYSGGETRGDYQRFAQQVMDTVFKL